MTTQLLLIRHGESTWNAESRIQGQADPPLSELGRRQAAALGRRLSDLASAALYTSPAVRARETSEAIAEPHGLIPRIEPALLEVHLGSWQGHRVSELSDEETAQFRAWERDPTALSPPGGETTSAALERVAPLLDRLLGNHAGDTVVIVTHSILGRVALSYLLGTGIQLVPRLRIKKASITKLRVQREMAILERLSDTSHLRSLS
ncbi:MAG TPA: histidine phosphatase family protein [Chloroflexota bacterium]|jgi:probable phosphoglycerate mutase